MKKYSVDKDMYGSEVKDSYYKLELNHSNNNLVLSQIIFALLSVICDNKG